MKTPPSNAYRSLCVKLPERVKGRLAREAARRGMSVNDLAGSLLGKHYGADFVEAGRRCTLRARADSLFVVLRLPPELVEAIRVAAWEARSNMTHEVALALAEELGVRIKMEDPRRSIPLGGGRRLIE